MAAIAGPLWGPARGVWGFFWGFIVIELVALVQIGRGLWGDLGADKLARAEKLQQRFEELYARGQQALQATDLLGETRLGDGEGLRGRGEAAVLGDRDEPSPQIALHRVRMPHAVELADGDATAADSPFPRRGRRVTFRR